MEEIKGNEKKKDMKGVTQTKVDQGVKGKQGKIWFLNFRRRGKL